MNPGRAILESPNESDWLKKAVIDLQARDFKGEPVIDDCIKLLEYARWLEFGWMV